MPEIKRGSLRIGRANQIFFVYLSKMNTLFEAFFDGTEKKYVDDVKKGETTSEI